MVTANEFKQDCVYINEQYPDYYIIRKTCTGYNVIDVMVGRHMTYRSSSYSKINEGDTYLQGLQFKQLNRFTLLKFIPYINRISKNDFFS